MMSARQQQAVTSAGRLANGRALTVSAGAIAGAAPAAAWLRHHSLQVDRPVRSGLSSSNGADKGTSGCTPRALTTDVLHAHRQIMALFR